MFLSLFQLFALSSLLWIYLIVPCFSYPIKFMFVFNMDETLLWCEKDLSTCTTNVAAVKFLKWLLWDESFQHRRPKLLLWSDGMNSKEKFQLTANSSSGLLPSSYFTGSEIDGYSIRWPNIIEVDKAKEFELLGPGDTKDLMVLRTRSELTGFVPKLIILFDNNLDNYLYNVCYKQYYKRGIWTIKVKDFVHSEGPAREKPHSSSDGFNFLDILLTFKELFNNRQVTLRQEYDKLMVELIHWFGLMQSRDTCGYSLIAPERLHFALVIDVTLLSSFPGHLVTTYLTEFFQPFSKLNVMPADNPLEALLFTCNGQASHEFCSHFDEDIQDVIDELFPADSWIHSMAALDYVIAGAQDARLAPFLGLMTHLPQATTLIVQVGGVVPTAGGLFLDKSIDSPNICYLNPINAKHNPGPYFLSRMKKLLKTGKTTLESDPLRPKSGNPLHPVYDALAQLLVELESIRSGPRKFEPTEIVEVTKLLQTKLEDSWLWCSTAG